MFIRDVLTYLRDISVLAQSPDFDGGEFQAYQAIGRSMSTRASTNESTTPLALQLGCELNSFNCSWQLSSGIGMVNIWTVFRPKTAIDTNQLEFSLRIKGLADQFDTLKFSSGASLRELESLQSSIVQIHGVAENISPLETNPLTVCGELMSGLQTLTRFRRSKRPLTTYSGDQICRKRPLYPFSSPNSKFCISMQPGVIPLPLCRSPH